MAQKSGGTVPAPQQIADCNHAHAILERVHHWKCTKVNREGKRPVYEVGITHAGHRVHAARHSFPEAVSAALEKLRAKVEPRLRLTN